MIVAGIAVGDGLGVAGGADNSRDASGGFEMAAVRRALAQTPWLVDYAFVIRSAADIEALLDAEIAATETGVDLTTALFVANRITPERYTAALARTLQVPAAGYDFEVEATAVAPPA